MSAPGRHDHRKRDEPDNPEPRARDGHRHHEKREVVEPYDGSEGEGGGDRDGERASLVTATCEDDDADQQRCAEYEPNGARDGRRQADVEADDVSGVGVLPTVCSSLRRSAG